MPERSLKDKTAKGLLWGGINNGAMQLLNLIFGIITSRILNDTDPCITIKDAIEPTRIACAIQQSLDTGAPVKL